MNYLPNPAVALSDFLTRLRLLPIFTFIVLAIMLVNDADARTRSSRIIGGSDDPTHDHGMTIRCTWPLLEGEWKSNTDPISVTHSVNENVNGEYATCSAWQYFDDGTNNVQYDPITGDVDHDSADFGQGKFYSEVDYTALSSTTCIEDPNSGHGNNCDGIDSDNTGNGGGNGRGDDTATNAATLSCADNLLPDGTTTDGTTLTFQFFCAEGVGVSGFLTLVPTLDDGTGVQVAQDAPGFTECSPERVAAGKCTMLYGGVPTTKRGDVDAKACLQAFPLANVVNALNSGQTQILAANTLLFYQETSHLGSCDTATSLPTEPGSPTAAFGRYCTSDIDTFEDNVAPNIYNDPAGVDGFDNELRVCRKIKGSKHHTGHHDVETVELTNILAVSQPNLNLNCKTGDNTDSGIFKVYITDQAELLAQNVDTIPLSDAPTLEGVSPVKAVINTDEYGVDTLELVYPTCSALSANVIFNNSLDDSLNNTNVTLELLGQTVSTETRLDQAINTLIEIKVNGL